MGFLLHHSIDEAAGREPDREAFRFDGHALTYTELVEQSNRLAHLLIAEGVRPHDRVGIYMTKGLELPVAVYGILKAGAAYVPVDPVAPPARVQFIVEDCGIRHIVTNASRATRARRLACDVPTLSCVVGADHPSSGRGGHSEQSPRLIGWGALPGLSSHSPEVSLIEQDLAYIIYTSGSTGTAKGLMHTHASGRSYAVLSAREYEVRPGDRLGNHSPLHFDMSTFEYLTGPLCGATTIIIPEETTMFPMSLAELIERERLTFWYSVPLALIQLLEQGGIEDRDLTALRWVLFGGEPFPPKQLARLAEMWPHARFSNSYGPAEVNQCTAYHVPPGSIEPDRPLPIGRVWPGAEGRIVDGKGHVVRPGDSGELLIHAPTMMRGYWSRPDLDRKAFVRNLSGQDEGQVFYRTGDLVREDDDGNLTFLGRKDRQVKIRGYRVELEEVEAVLNALPGVAEAAVVNVRDRQGNASIVAAVLLDKRSAAVSDAAGLRHGAAQRLSAYTVPSQVDIRETLPRTGSGKIDYPALTSDYRSVP